MAQGKLHTYHPQRGLLLFEHDHPLVRTSSSGESNVSPATSNPAAAAAQAEAEAPTPKPNNMLLFVGGMFDNFLSPGYTLSLARLLSHSSRWRIAHIQLSSAMRGFGVSSLGKDVQEINAGVKFVREHLLTDDSKDKPNNNNDNTTADPKIVLMGHSTGCQDLLSYLYLSTQSAGKASERAKVHGAILQAPVSDREGSQGAAASSPDQQAKWDRCVEIARATPDRERRTTVLPMHLTSRLFGPVPLSVERFWSLASPDSPGNPGEDDLFSSDGTEERHAKTWGVAVGGGDGGDGGDGGGGVLHPLKASGKREILVLMSGSDEHVPKHVDMAALMGRWKTATERAGGALHRASRVVEGGLHDLGGDDAAGVRAREVLMRRAVAEYLADVLGEGGVEAGVERELRRVEEEEEKKKEEVEEAGRLQQQQQQQQQQGDKVDVVVESKI